MTNPTIRSQAKPAYTEMPPRSFFFYGESKVGKTETSAGFPAPLILNPKVEDRTSEIVGDVWDIPIGDTGQLKAAITYLQSGKHPYQYVVFDAVTAYIDDIIAKQDGYNPLRKTKAANDLLIPILTDFFALPIGKVLSGHAKHDTEEIKIEGKSAIKHSIIVDLPQSFRTFVTARVTAYGYCYPAQGGSKVRWTPLEQPKLSIAAGNALGLPDVTELRYDAIYHAIVTVAKKPAPTPSPAPEKPTPTTAAPPAQAQAARPEPASNLNGSQKKWEEFVKGEKITTTTIKAALGTDKPSVWLAHESNKGKTVDDCIRIVRQFIANTSKHGKPAAADSDF